MKLIANHILCKIVKYKYRRQKLQLKQQNVFYNNYNYNNKNYLKLLVTILRCKLLFILSVSTS